MKRFQNPVFQKADAGQVHALAADFKARGYTFVNINVTTCPDGCEVLYVYRAPEQPAELEGRTVIVAPGQVLESITDLYPAAFVFENEAHDLFGIEFAGLSIDYQGNFYKLSLSYPMNPRAAADDAPAAGEDTTRGEA